MFDVKEETGDDYFEYKPHKLSDASVKTNDSGQFSASSSGKSCSNNQLMMQKIIMFNDNQNVEEFEEIPDDKNDEDDQTP